jgi:predicted SAM-dependent methyltransferase
MKFEKDKRILNVGCGNDTFGTERIDIIKTPSTTKVVNIERKFPFNSNSFDEVYCEYVLEHMKNPYNLILEMKRVCKSGGKITIITDNAGYILANIKFMGLHGDYSDKAVHGDSFNKSDRHYALYSPEHLRNFFIGAGLKINKKGFIFWKNVSSKKSRLFHFILKLIIGKRFGQPSVFIVGQKI